MHAQSSTIAALVLVPECGLVRMKTTNRIRARARATFGLVSTLTLASACVGEIGEGRAVPETEQPIVTGARRLSRTEYDQTLLDLLGDDSRPGFALLASSGRATT